MLVLKGDKKKCLWNVCTARKSQQMYKFSKRYVFKLFNINLFYYSYFITYSYFIIFYYSYEIFYELFTKL